MVDIAQLVSASDCGSEGRGFESHYPPHKKDTQKGVFFYGDNGIRKSGPTVGRVKKCPVGSDPSAASGGLSEESEWQRSTDTKALCRRR